MSIKSTEFWKWYEPMYEGPDGDFSGIPIWHKDDMWDAWCAALAYADEKGVEDSKSAYQRGYMDGMRRGEANGEKK